MKKIPVALQLYSVRDACKADFFGTIRKVAQMGYDGVEFAGYYGAAAGELRKVLDDCDLKAAGTHLGLDALAGDEFEKTVEFNRTLGNDRLIVAWLAEERRSTQGQLEDTVKRFDEIAARAAACGMRFGYHNHWFEFETEFGGEKMWDFIFRRVRPEVLMQYDTGNALRGGGDAAHYLKAYASRAATVHLKSFSKVKEDVLLGDPEDEVPWGEVFKLCEKSGKTEWYVIEQERYPFPPLECARKCLENLRRLQAQRGK